MHPGEIAWISSVALWLLSAGVARAEPTVSASGRVGVYGDDDATRVVTSVVGAEATAFEHARVGAHYLVDLVSSASVDVVSAATGRFEEARRELGVEGGYVDSRHTATLAYRRSAEHDWLSNTGVIAVSRDFFEHGLKLGLSLALTSDRVGRANDAHFRRRLWEHVLGASAVVVLDRDDVLSLGYAGGYLVGYLASPYRYAHFFDPLAGASVSAPEVVPDTRLRHALVVEHARHLFRESALRSHARGYLDDWGIVSGTAGTEYVLGFGDFEPSLFVRGYVQSGARFYADGYPERRRFMTADSELSPFWDAFGGAGLSYRVERLGPFEELRVDGRAAAFYFAYQEFARRPTRRGVTLELGVGGAL